MPQYKAQDAVKQYIFKYFFKKFNFKQKFGWVTLVVISKKLPSFYPQFKKIFAASIMGCKPFNFISLFWSGFDVNSIPMQAWNTNRISGKVGHRIYDSYVEGKGWEKRQQKDNLINEKQKNK